MINNILISKLKKIELDNYIFYLLFFFSISILFFLSFYNLHPTKYIIDIAIMLISITIKREFNFYKHFSFTFDISKIFLLILALSDGLIYSLMIYNIVILISFLLDSLSTTKTSYFSKERFPHLVKLQKEIKQQKDILIYLEHTLNILLFTLIYLTFSYIPLPKNIFIFSLLFFINWAIVEKIFFYLYKQYKISYLSPYLQKFFSRKNSGNFLNLIRILHEVSFTLIFFVISFYLYPTLKIYLLLFFLIISISLQDKDYIKNQILTFILLVIDLLEKKDRYTFDHSYRVALISYNLAKELHLDPLDIDKIYKAALIHDLGKILIPDEIINKKGKLTPQEFEIIKLHVKELKSILNPIYQFLKEIVDIAELHHERLDGKGYPYGYKGENIPLESRILAIADTFDALIIDRPYRPGYSYQKAISILIEDSQKEKLDPFLVDIFVKIIPQTEILESIKKVKTMLKIYQGKIIENMVSSLTNFIDEII